MKTGGTTEPFVVLNNTGRTPVCAQLGKISSWDPIERGSSSTFPGVLETSASSMSYYNKK